MGSPTSTNNSDSRSPPNKYPVVEARGKKVERGMRADEFTMGKKLGEGKFGVVHLARHRKSGMVVALKKIPKSMIQSHFMVDQLAL